MNGRMNDLSEPVFSVVSRAIYRVSSPCGRVPCARAPRPVSARRNTSAGGRCALVARDLSWCVPSSSTWRAGSGTKPEHDVSRLKSVKQNARFLFHPQVQSNVDTSGRIDFFGFGMD